MPPLLQLIIRELEDHMTTVLQLIINTDETPMFTYSQI
jgi:hypothetical protein